MGEKKLSDDQMVLWAKILTKGKSKLYDAIQKNEDSLLTKASDDFIQLLGFEFCRENSLTFIKRLLDKMPIEVSKYALLTILKSLDFDFSYLFFHFEKEGGQTLFLTSMRDICNKIKSFLDSTDEAYRQFFSWQLASYVFQYENYMMEHVLKSEERDRLIMDIMRILYPQFENTGTEGMTLDQMRERFPSIPVKKYVTNWIKF
ncbi:MAG: hypothetical protein HEEMFOPI_00512 [Holosporales bacterium]